MKLNLNSTLTWILFIITGVTIFIGYFTIRGEILQSIILCLIPILTLLATKKNKIQISADTKLWLLLFLLMVISLIYTIEFNYSLKYITWFGFLLIYKICLDNINDWKKTAFICLYLFSLIHVIATVIYAIRPEFIQSIVKTILPANKALYNINLYRYGAIAGICADHGTNAIFISIFIALSFSLLIKRKKIINIIMTILGIIALLLTAKRGHLIANIAAMIITFLVNNKNNKKTIKNTVYLSICFIIIIIIIRQFPATNFIFERFASLSEEGNLLNGRDGLYSVMFNSITNNFILGTGIRTTLILTGGNDGHNIFLQIMTELGIVGIIILTFILIKNIFNMIKQRQNIYTSSSICFQIFFLINGLTGNPLYILYTLVTYFVMTSKNFITIGEGEDNEDRNINLS